MNLLDIVGGRFPTTKEADDCDKRDEKYHSDRGADADVEYTSRRDAVTR